MTVPQKVDLDNYVSFPSKSEALAAAKKEGYPTVFVRFNAELDGWGIRAQQGWLVWSELPKIAYQMSDELPSVAHELAEIWEITVDEFIHAYSKDWDFTMEFG